MISYETCHYDESSPSVSLTTHQEVIDCELEAVSLHFRRQKDDVSIFCYVFLKCVKG